MVLEHAEALPQNRTPRRNRRAGALLTLALLLVGSMMTAWFAFLGWLVYRGFNWFAASFQ